MKPETIRQIARFGLAGFWTWFVMVTFFGSLPDSPMRLAKDNKMKLVSVLPEGWSFFTKSPRDPEIFVHQETSSGWEPLTFRPATRRGHYGLTRISRVVGVEVAGLTMQVPDTLWADHADPFAPGADLSAIPVIDARNVAVRRTVCGEVLLERREPVPWAWSRSGRPISMPAEYVRLAVDCTVPPPNNDPNRSLMDALRPASANAATPPEEES